ncbi:hypothetical protein ASPTUDRAFT_74528 [Aspergillus tubingensis CBS 134.48]|uniref:Nephrocystin 3-like N-terminal domain-containing protein n=1 Tax=Aspergillus tubingensis (strain CBS 134.48) TaxID=767770 RepID=A0A1L9N6U6_ASPTC|nr:hypothetical protein ASPTUDRAFT_74528 [Aspergillus tubingensis CBS 134.48]
MLQTIERINAAIRQDLQGINNTMLLQVEKRFRETSSELKKDLETIIINQSFNRLHIAPEAGIEAEKYDKKDRCFEGTQTSIIQCIRDWIESPGPEYIFWLHGVAGGGKSTISRTIAVQCRDRKSFSDTTCLGASFFFDKNEIRQSNATYLFPTLCQSLADCLPELKYEICKSLEEHPGAGKEHVSLRMQWNHLILQPLLNLEKRNRLLPLTLVVVIDALDECQPMSDDDPVSAILRLLDEARQLNFVRLKFFLTSRPQKHIFTSFEHDVSESHCCIAGLHGEGSSYDKGRFRHDIKMTLKHKLREIADRHGLKPKWPGDERLNALAEMADGLWIYASTAWRFIGDYRVTRERAKSRLDLLLKDDRTPRETVDKIYVEVLQDILDPATPEETHDTRLNFQAIVGAIIVLCEPLSMATLSNLVRKNIADTKDLLESLSSVIHLAASQDFPVRLVHPSFPEYLTSPERCLDRTFLISRKEKHVDLFFNCIEALTNMLKCDICQLGDVLTKNCDIDSETVDQRIPSHLKYACIYWVEHLQLSGASHLVIDDGPVFMFLKEHLLQWLKSLSIMGMVSEGTRAVIKLSEYLLSLPRLGRSELCDFVDDMKRFVRHTRSIIERAPLQVYISALIYSPEQSLVRKQYENAVPEWVIDPPDMRKAWSPLLQTLGGYEAVSDISHIGKGLALSPDGKLLATSKVEIWDTTTGTLLNTLKPMGFGCSVSFSGDGKEVISLSKEGNLKVWDVSSGRSIKQINSPIRGHWALAQTISVNKTRSASYSLDGTLVLFDIKRGKVIKSFKPHKSKLLSMNLSPNGELLATLCTKGTVRIWNTMDATLEHSFEADKYVKISTGKVVFCPAEEMIAVLWAREITIWCLKTHHKLKSFPADDARDLIFSHESKFLISSLFDQRQKGEIKWWDWASGTAVKTVKGGGQLLQLSPCGRLLASAQDNESHHRNLINIWDARSGELLQVLDDSTSPAKIFEFSNNGKVYACGNSQGNHVAVMRERISLWNIRTKSPAIEVESWFPDKALFSPGGRLFANHTILSAQVWSMDTGELVCVLPKKFWEDSEFTFSPKGNIFAQAVWMSYLPDFMMYRSKLETGLEDDPPQPDHTYDRENYSINIWNRKTGELGPVLKGSGHKISCLAFSPDEELLAVTLPDRGISIWSLSSGKVVTGLLISDSDANISHTVWSPDDTHLASVCSNGTVLLWDTVTWTLRRLIANFPPEEKNTPRAIAFSSDGKLLASGYTRGLSSWKPRSPEGGTCLWDVNTGNFIGMRGIATSRQTLRFSTDGRSIMTDIGRVDVRLFYKELEYSSSRDLAVFDNEWIWVRKEVILLLNDYHATCATAINNDLLIMSHVSGKITFL